MRAFIRKTWLVSETVWIEAIRRREIYVIVIVAVALIGGSRFVRFFEMEGLERFHREIALKTMNIATALTVILLAARQLPREFENRTLYPLLAKPIGRWNFLLGKFMGVMGAAAFCYGLFMAIFIVGQLASKEPFNWILFAQFVYLQAWNFAILAALSYLLSMLLNFDAALTITTILYLFSQTFLNMMSYVYDEVGAIEQKILLALHFLLPQLTLFDASAKVIHDTPLPGGGGTLWPSIAPWAIAQLTLYGMIYTAIYLGATSWLLRRRPL